MKKLSFLIIIMMLLTFRVSNGQNLVANSDFELYTLCPNGYGQINLAAPWFNPSSGTPDYLNQCATVPNVGVPTNQFGFQPAHSGVAYTGLYLFSQPPAVPEFREYLEAPLTTPLIAGNSYYFEMFINLANGSKFTSDDIGIYFSNTIVAGISSYNALPFTPQISNSSGIFTDTINWTLISGNYIASGGESYLIIGNFKNDNNSTIIPANNNGNIDGAYCYIDDISLTVGTGTEEVNIFNFLNIYPNPAKDKLNVVANNNELLEIMLYDITSRKILQLEFTNTVTLNIEQFEKGVYLYEVRSRDGLCRKGKVLKD